MLLWLFDRLDTVMFINFYQLNVISLRMLFKFNSILVDYSILFFNKMLITLLRQMDINLFSLVWKIKYIKDL